MGRRVRSRAFARIWMRTVRAYGRPERKLHRDAVSWFSLIYANYRANFHQATWAFPFLFGSLRESREFAKITMWRKRALCVGKIFIIKINGLIFFQLERKRAVPSIWFSNAHIIYFNIFPFFLLFTGARGSCCLIDRQVGTLQCPPRSSGTWLKTHYCLLPHPPTPRNIKKKEQKKKRRELVETLK